MTWITKGFFIHFFTYHLHTTVLRHSSYFLRYNLPGHSGQLSKVVPLSHNFCFISKYLINKEQTHFQAAQYYSKHNTNFASFLKYICPLVEFRLRLYWYYKAGNPIILHNFNMSSVP